MMRVTCIGHSGFAIEVGDAMLIFDYYVDPAAVLPELLARGRRIYVFVSHSHRDHLNMDIFAWAACYPVARYVIANECRRKLKRAIDVDALPVTWMHHDEDWCDGVVAVHAFNSTDVGVSFLVDVAGYCLFHAGDLNCWHFSEENDEQQVRKAVGDYTAILRRVAHYAPHITLAMFPVVPNIGGDFALGARSFLQAVQVDDFIAMHTWGRDREAGNDDLYRNPSHGRCHILVPAQSLLLGGDMENRHEKLVADN